MKTSNKEGKALFQSFTTHINDGTDTMNMLKKDLDSFTDVVMKFKPAI